MDMDELADHTIPDKFTTEMDELAVAHIADDRFGTDKLAVTLLLTRLELTVF
jgi:hypothetical protein